MSDRICLHLWKAYNGRKKLSRSKEWPSLVGSNISILLQKQTVFEVVFAIAKNHRNSADTSVMTAYAQIPHYQL